MIETLSMQMLKRLNACANAHPHTILNIVCKPPNMEQVISGKAVHCMVTKGTLLQVRWIPAKDVQWIFDAYGA